VIDLTSIGQNLTAEQWYGGLMVQLGDRLGIEDDLIGILASQTMLGPMQEVDKHHPQSCAYTISWTACGIHR